MRYVVEIAGVSWIKADPSPVSYAAEALYWKPDWIPKVCIGLTATANPPPPPQIQNFEAFRLTKNFRSLTYIKASIDVNDKSFSVDNVLLQANVIDGGFTPPFNRGRYKSTYLKPDDSMSDPAFYPGELSSLSKVTVKAAHPNSSITKLGDDVVVLNSIAKFRAGAHTDAIGISVGSPFHVPWVWSEMLLGYRKKERCFCLYAAGSKFPTHSWYVKGKQVMGQQELSDKGFPHDGRQIMAKSMNLYPALATGVPAEKGQIPATESLKGAVTSHPFTLGGYALPSIHVFQP